jgi:hypothetical protein
MKADKLLGVYVKKKDVKAAYATYAHTVGMP